MTGCPSSALVYKSPAFKSGVGFKVFAAPCTVCIFEGVWIFGRQVEFGTVELFKIYGAVRAVFDSGPSCDDVIVIANGIMKRKRKRVNLVCKI